MIRRAEDTEVDFAHIFGMASDFNADYYDVPLNEHKFRTWYSYVVDRGVIFFTDASFIAGFPFEDPIRDYTIMFENGWYSQDNSGLRLLKEFIKYGKDLGVDEVRVCTMNTSGERVNRILNRMGFLEIERSLRLQF